MPSNACWGIEIGAGALKAVKLERSGDGVICSDFAIIPHKRVLSTPETDEKDAKRVALGTLVSQHDLDKAGIAVSVPGHSTFARFAKLPPVEPKKIPDIVKFEAVQQIPFPIDEVEWDYQTFTAPDSPDVEVGIFAMTREKVMEKLAKWQDVGHTPDALTLSPLAAYNAVTFDQVFGPQTPGTVILDIGTTSTDLIVAEGGRMWIRTFPIGGHQFTEALVTAFNLSYSKAEKLKKEAESTQHTRHVLQAMRPVFGDLAQDVQRSIGYYQSLHREAKLTRLIGLGSTFQLPGLKKFLSQQLQMEVQALDGYQRIKYEGQGGDEKKAEFAANAGILATAIGCALQGLGDAAIGANLMPLPIVREAVWTRKSKWFVAAAGIALAAGGVAFVRPVIDRAALAGTPRPAEIDTVKRQAKSLKDAYARVEAEAKTDFRASNSQLLLTGRDIYADICDDFVVQLEDHIAKVTANPAAPEGIYERVRMKEIKTTYSLTVSAAGETDAKKVKEAENAAATGEGETKPRIVVNMTITVALPKDKSYKAVDDVLKAWQAKQNKIDGRAYKIMFGANPWKPGPEEVVAADGKSAQNAAPTPSPGETAGRTTTRPPGPGRGTVGPGGEAGGRARNPRPSPGGEGETPTPPVSNPSAASKIGFSECEKLAPLGLAPPIAPPGSTVTVYEIQWEAVFNQVEGAASMAPAPAPSPAPAPGARPPATGPGKGKGGGK